ncbi:MAG TPA: cupin domain-containing protein [Ktedonobacteraceae bacterium]|nr:cupin domain-containing protein [Ktedonobacteraceae bacterium]
MSLAAIQRSAISAKADRGGQMHILLSPKTVETQTGFMGTLVLAPEEVYKNHYHPYSDEYLYVIDGEITITGDTNTITAQTSTGVFIPKNTPHRLQNTGDVNTVLVFFSTPLAPRPELGHVMLED